MNKNLIYFVDEIETSFVINDIQRLSESFESIQLFSVDQLDDVSKLPSNVTFNDTYLNWTEFNPKSLLLKHFPTLFLIYVKECYLLKKLLPFKKSMAVLTSNLFKSISIKNALESSPKDSVFYAFWFYDCIYLAFLKHLGFAQKIVVRAHGGDLFEERSSLSGNVLFRNFQLSKIDKVFSVSKVGTQYLKNKYKKYESKIDTIYLGSYEHSILNPFDSNCVTLVSCAKIRNIKRIFAIAEALFHTKSKITWYHLGDENLGAKNDTTIHRYLEAKEKLKEKTNVQLINMGLMDNKDIFEFYNNTPISLFISLSETEGIPVSMMEAISFGIPILSTDVGGCHEIVTENTGQLVPLNSNETELAQFIDSIPNSKFNTIEFREKTRKFWDQNFNFEKNYKQFINHLEEL